MLNRDTITRITYKSKSVCASWSWNCLIPVVIYTISQLKQDWKDEKMILIVFYVSMKKWQ